MIAHDGIWQSLTPASSNIDNEYRLTLGEGSTALELYSKDPKFWLKREDLNPTGSHKDRAAAYQLAVAAANASMAVTISSSGNAAIATSRYAALHDIPAVVFVHPSTDIKKLSSIDGATTLIIMTERAINGAKLLAREAKIPNLRPSTNDDSLIGYASLGEELARELPQDVDAVVIFATSGAAAIAVADVLVRMHPPIQLHVVQGEGNAGLVAPDHEITDDSAHKAAAGRLGVRRSRRIRQLQAAIESTGGAGHVATVDDITQAHKQLAMEGIIVSDESAANFAVAQKLAAAGQHPCAIISGAPCPAQGARAKLVEAKDEHDALKIALSWLEGFSEFIG